jgi:hypothetical protein
MGPGVGHLSHRGFTIRTLRAWLAAAVLLCPAVTSAQKFFPDDPLLREPPPLPAPDPTPRNLSVLLEAWSGTVGRPGERQPDRGVIAAQGTNTLGDVPDGAWYVNRHGRNRMSLADLVRGSGNTHAPSMAGPWQVLLIKSHGLRPGIVFRDASNQVFVIRFDRPGSPEMATAAGMISSHFFHALGYHVPESYLVTFERTQLHVGEGAGEITTNAEVRKLLPAQLDNLLASVHRGGDGRYRALALFVPVDVAALAGPYQLFGTRSDDPNDTVAHEHRRDLRGLWVFAAWLNHARMDALHTFDIVVQPPGEAPHIRHHLFDFMSTLGSGLSGPKASWEGRDLLYGQNSSLRNIASLGLYSPAWMRASYPDFRGVGHFDAKTFEPEKWRPVYDTAPFANRLPDDEFWAARQVMAFTDEEIRAIVQTGQFSDPRAAQWIADCLIERRNRIGRAYFAKVLPLDTLRVANGALAFDDLAVTYGFASPRRYRVGWSRFDNAAGKPSSHIGNVQEDLQVPSEAAGSANGGYVLARITAEGLDPDLAVNVYLRREADGLRIVGLDREWPGRELVNPPIVARTVRNRYAEFDPVQQQLFTTYVRTLNARTGITLTPDERFRELGPSEQTTYDAVTHALLRSALTDDDGRPLGSALDLVSGLERVAGEQAGRSGDEQFRLFVTLRPDAKDILDRSREFVRSHQNTVYHVGYPQSYRLGSGVPSVQFSVSEDGLKADIDVDYRASKAPASLFNGHLTSSNSDVRAGDNADRHTRRWNGFANWWSEVFGTVRFADRPDETTDTFGAAPGRTAESLPPNRPPNASIPELSDAMQEFLTDWLVRRNFEEASAFLAPETSKCVADSMNLKADASPERLRRATVELLQRAANTWGRATSLAEAMNPVVPWSPSVRILKHPFERDFTLVEAPTELGEAFACGAPPPPKRFQPSATPVYGTYYGAVLQIVQEGRPGGTLVVVWRRINSEWRIVAYRAVE